MYIRTKDGRIIDTTKIVTGSKFMDFATNDESFRVIFKTEPLAKSENLEDLCDRFVYFDITHRTHIVCSLEEYKRYKQDKYWTCDLHIWYGAIWVDGKGLIYVAKMNDKGELCLL